MVLPEDAPCSITKTLGHQSLYDVENDDKIAEGVIVATELLLTERRDVVLFRLEKAISLFVDDFISVEKGSSVIYKGTEVKLYSQVGINLCRYPTKEEYEFYLNYYEKTY